jgi:hypothetical protein
MPLQITLRRNAGSSPFRRQLLRLCSLPGAGELFISSGYIYEPDDGYGILRDGLADAIKSGIGNHQLTTIAGKLTQIGRMDWPEYYRNFVARLRSNGVNVRAFAAPRRNWHAKIAVMLDLQGKPVAAIVGSSNLTGPAFGEGRGSWNYESDVTIWVPTPAVDQHFRDPSGQGADPYEDIVTVLDPATRQPNEEARIAQLLEDMQLEHDSFEKIE